MLIQEAVNEPVRKIAALRRMVGNTPLLGIHCKFRGRHYVVYAKSEQSNMTGSIKDRMALHILSQAHTTGQIHDGDTIAEATSGNTGISFAAIGRALGHPVVIFMPDWMSRERKDLIRSYGAEIVPVSHEQGGFLGSIQRAEEFAAGRKDVFLPRQFSNQANVEAHEATTGPEIWLQLESAGLRPDAFVAGVGTGGTVMGVARFLLAQNPKIRVHPVEPAESPTFSTGQKVGTHRIQGISDEFIPPIVDLSLLDEVIPVSDGDSIIMAQKMAATLGLAVGISSGCNFLAALLVQEKLGTGAVVVTVFADDNKKYLSTDLMKEEPVHQHYLAPEVELLGLSAMGRTCDFCEGQAASRAQAFST
ncbi:MAG: PLP-dependent cysteine synthase family protein [Terriglobales bacterium]